ncbi:hypothetical protein QAD02_002930 [Eretmocerus hayati]|uniref:Uncharacterized protein n=1 Tax=Eretmocerus hayati TaxID=131215 RepID=A0ACC2NL91_9HYME|nr:hypothetical protein QAD02_002930 [Eretmocerus hayati]
MFFDSIVNLNISGHLSDSSMYSVSNLRRKLANHEMALPPPGWLPNSNVELPHVFLADEIFPFSQNVMKPYNRSRLTGLLENTYNFRHSRGRMPVECQYRNLQVKWEILRQPSGFDLSVTNDLIISILALNNFLINSDNPDLPTSEVLQQDREQMVVDVGQSQLSPAEIRQRFAAYLVRGEPGYLPWADRYIRSLCHLLQCMY